MALEFHITDNAVLRIKDLNSKKLNGNYLKISVNGGGCSGFEYEFSFVQNKQEEDFLFSKDGINIVIDQISAPFLNKATLDYINDIGNAAFKVINPNADSHCGCGKSFSPVL